MKLYLIFKSLIISPAVYEGWHIPTSAEWTELIVSSSNKHIDYKLENHCISPLKAGQKTKNRLVDYFNEMIVRLSNLSPSFWQKQRDHKLKNL